ncbi:hypothetical protein N7476_005412 [Penicillium atrosanguineum]|uniref:Exocyst complex component Sec3 PIP2-binding N-terminal domain-containing protein n=1 Tax=Penicillium atrosanguineum TaxID=1132637 RepID=A0A9W9PVK8_9EURO|nr:hypothetical protein N7526_008875 [Penicillium atrosanguineum]KAJ5315105.1 hypothetical protein N7476_005412 [Penicillium atrosanguineum]
MNGRDRPRPPPPSDARRVGDRNGSDGSMSRAEKFEDEKKRIIQSCYSKKDADGTLVESYITHVRIVEDATYPSAPAPPDSNPQNKKPRVIIVSVRRSGRVRMHKARENNDGSFSIGKTWMLDDLSAIQSYSAFVPKSATEQQHKEWAGSVGFVITVGKPYYWHARTSKEKEFFIGSLVKIFKKYTGGKVPDLIGFDERERQLLAASGSAGPVAPPGRGPPLGLPSGPPPGPPGGAPSEPPVPTQSAYSSRDPSRDAPRDLRRKASEDPTLRSQKSREQLSRPSTASKPAPSPFSTSPNNQPIIPPRPEPKSQDAPTTFLNTSDEGAALTAHASNPRALVPKISTDGLRPNTPGSFNSETRGYPSSPGSSVGPKSPYREGVEKGSPLDQQSRPSQDKIGSDALSPLATKNEYVAYSPAKAEVPSSPIVFEPEVAAAVVAAEEPPKTAEEEPKAAASQTPQPPPTETPQAEVTPAEATQASIIPTESTEEEYDAHRPGLGPMIKKKASAKDVAGAFRKAANAYGAFKPRPGGAGERLLAAAKKQQAEEAGSDGVTGVFHAPSLARSGNEPPKSPVEATLPQEPPAIVPSPASAAAAAATAATAAAIPVPTDSGTPTVEVTQPVVEETPLSPGLPKEESKVSLTDIVKVKDRSRTPSPAAPARNRRRREDHTIKYCQALGIDPGVLDGRGIEFDDILTDLGWNGRLGDEKKIEDLEADIRREIGRVEATSWLGNLEQQEGKVEQLAVLIDKTMEECEELEGLLTLYSHELNTLNDDVAYIETQSQGLQVQTANQKLLQTELQNLLKTLSITNNEMRPLKEASLSNPNALRDTEIALSTLYKAMLMIDADIGQNKKRQADASVGVYANTEFGQMRAIQEKKVEYRSASMVFLQRLKQHIAVAFKMADQKRADAMASSTRDPMKLDSTARQQFRDEVWMYNPLMLFAREVSMPEWQALVNLYEQLSKPSYQNDFRENSTAWKKTAKKPTGDESELLFTHQEKEKEGEGITMAARKLTVRRGKTVRAAVGFRLASSEKKPGKIEACEAFAGTLRETLNMVSEEQNFVVEYFHLNSLATADFSDLVTAAPPDVRKCPSFSTQQSHDPDRSMARRVEGVMDEVFSFWPNDLQSCVDWALQADPMQGIGILFALESAMADLDDTNQEFIIHALQKVHSRLMGMFNRFVDEQIRGIEDTKVKVNKRKGVISFIRVFPHFSTAVENMLVNGEFCDIRIGVNEAYERINRAMWESLKFIAKEAPGQPLGVAASAGDPEDKEVLNYHILLIENMNHYHEEVQVHNLPVLQRWVDRAHQDFDEHMKLYLDAVIHRPLGKLLDFVQSIENLQANGNAADIASRASHSRMVAKKVLSSYDSKEIKRGVEMLKKRVEKHFGDADDPGLSRSLVIKVIRECEIRYEEAYDRTRRIIDTVYDGQLELEWRKEDALAMFRK